MIEANHRILVSSPIESVWLYARDMARWADIFPGCQGFSQVDEDRSEWTIKVGVGGLVRTVEVQVHVEDWQGPERVDFSYKLKSEPVVGRGSYTAVSQGCGETEITLHVEVQGSGQMAPMWESMCRPVIPMLLKAFGRDFKREVESEEESDAGHEVEAAVAMPTAELSSSASSPSRFRRLLFWLRSLWSPTARNKATSR